MPESSPPTDAIARVALVTGGSSGIGRGASLALARAGHAVAVHGLDLAEAQQVAAAIRDAGGAAIGVAGPIDDPATSAAAVDATITAFGRLDALVTSAGIQRYGDTVSTAPDEWDTVFAVNVKGVYLAARAALPHIRLSPAGSVVIVASVQGSMSQTQVAAYAASKGALLSLARSMAVDEAAFGVRVNSVSPGSVDTPMLRASAAAFSDGSPEAVEELLGVWGTAHALGRVGTIDEIGEAIAYLSGEKAGFISGVDLRVDGGMLARLPAPLPTTPSSNE